MQNRTQSSRQNDPPNWLKLSISSFVVVSCSFVITYSGNAIASAIYATMAFQLLRHIFNLDNRDPPTGRIEQIDPPKLEMKKNCADGQHRD